MRISSVVSSMPMKDMIISTWVKTWSSSNLHVIIYCWRVVAIKSSRLSHLTKSIQQISKWVDAKNSFDLEHHITNKRDIQTLLEDTTSGARAATNIRHWGYYLVGMGLQRLVSFWMNSSGKVKHLSHLRKCILHC